VISRERCWRSPLKLVSAEPLKSSSVRAAEERGGRIGEGWP